MERYVVKLTLKDGGTRYTTFRSHSTGYYRMYEDLLEAAGADGDETANRLERLLKNGFDSTVFENYNNQFSRDVISYQVLRVKIFTECEIVFQG